MKSDIPNLMFETVTDPIMIHQQIVESAGETAFVHSHNYIELLYCFGGEFNIWLDGKYFEFKNGDMVVINSHEVHCINCICPEKNGGYICIRFTPDILYGSTQKLLELKYVLPFLTNHNPPQKIFNTSEIENTEVPMLINRIYSEYISNQYACELAIRSDIYRIFLWILRYWKSNGLDTEKKIDIDLASKLQPALDYISSHFNETLTAEFMAEYANMSYSYFSRIFKQLIGKGFSEYLNFIRITESEKLLLTTDMNITEIALSVGFSTSSYFIRQFKLYKNIPPKQFKKIFLY